MEQKLKEIYFAAGQFYKPQFLFDQLNGVVKTEVGFMSTDPMDVFDADDFKRGFSDFLQTIKITFDPNFINYRTLLDFFWQTVVVVNADQTGDKSTNTAIFYTNEMEQALASLSKLEHQKKLNLQIQTQILKANRFYLANEKQQKFYQKMGIFGKLTEEEERGVRRKITGLDQFDKPV